MAKRRHPQPGETIAPGVRALDAMALVANATDLRESPFTYANHAMFSLSANEIFIDLYQLGPEPGGTGKVQALFIERIVVPMGLGKGFATGIANIVASYEKAFSVVVPNNRKPDPEDIIKIWDEE